MLNRTVLSHCMNLFFSISLYKTCILCCGEEVSFDPKCPLSFLSYSLDSSGNEASLVVHIFISPFPVTFDERDGDH